MDKRHRCWGYKRVEIDPPLGNHSAAPHLGDDEPRLPSLDDYTPPNKGEEKLKFWITLAIVVIAAIIIMPLLISAVLSGMAGSIEHPRVVAVMVNQPDAGTITVTFMGGEDTGSLVWIEGTVMDSSGKVQRQFLGSKTGKSPLLLGTVMKFNGTRAGRDRVVVNGGFSDGREQVIWDDAV